MIDKIIIAYIFGVAIDNIKKPLFKDIKEMAEVSGIFALISCIIILPLRIAGFVARCYAFYNVGVLTFTTNILGLPSFIINLIAILMFASFIIQFLYDN